MLKNKIKYSNNVLRRCYFFVFGFYLVNSFKKYLIIFLNIEIKFQVTQNINYIELIFLSLKKKKKKKKKKKRKKENELIVRCKILNTK